MSDVEADTETFSIYICYLSNKLLIATIYYHTLNAIDECAPPQNDRDDVFRFAIFLHNLQGANKKIKTENEKERQCEPIETIEI